MEWLYEIRKQKILKRNLGWLAYLVEHQKLNQTMPYGAVWLSFWCSTFCFARFSSCFVSFALFAWFALLDLVAMLFVACLLCLACLVCLACLLYLACLICLDYLIYLGCLLFLAGYEFARLDLARDARSLGCSRFFCKF